MTEKGRRFWRNAASVSLTALFLRCVSVSFNVYLTDKLGADGIGLYSLIMSVYSFAVTVATSGIHLATTRLVAEAGEDPRAVRGAMRASLGYSALFGFGAAILLFVLAPTISAYWLQDERTLPALRLLALGLPPLAMSSALGGYFAGVRRVYKSSAVQLCEQGTRVTVTICALQLVLPRGLGWACIGVVAGGMLAELLSFLLLLAAYLADRARHFPRTDARAGQGMMRRLCGIALPVAVSAYARSLLLTVEHLLIPVCLRKNGATRDASLAAYGTLTSMVMPILLFPSALLSSVSGLLIPEMAELKVQDRDAAIRRLAARVLRPALLFSIGAAGVMSCNAWALGNVIYSSPDAAHYIRLLAPLVPVMYLDNTVDAMLKGLGEQVYSMRVNIADATLSVILVALLLPRFGIAGYVIVLYVCEGFNAVCSLYRLLSITAVRVDLVGWIVRPLIAIVGATVAGRWLGTHIPAADAIGLALRLAVTAAAYLALLWLTELPQKWRGGGKVHSFSVQ